MDAVCGWMYGCMGVCVCVRMGWLAMLDVLQAILKHTCLKKDLHCLGAGVFSRLMYGIITIVAGSTGACIELCNL